MRNAKYYDVVSEFNASGSHTTTTGTVSGNSRQLTVASAATFSVGHGILVKGAGNAGAHHVSSITAIEGNVITLAQPAKTAVGNAVVQHDDTAAINAALATACKAGGGQVFLRSGHYRCNAPLNPKSNSILTLPQDISYVWPVRIELVGEVRARVGADNNSIPAGGVAIDATDAPAGSGTDPAVFAGAPTAAEGFKEWQNADVFIDKILLVLAPNPTLSGLNFSNCLRGSVGDSFAAFAPFDSQPTHDSTGIIFPQAHNNVILGCGKAQIVGFKVGIRASEHLIFSGPYIGLCATAVEITNPSRYSLHLISGSLCIESCPTMIRKTGPGNQAVSLTLQSEISFPNKISDEFHKLGGHWFDGIPGQDVVDTGNTLYGKIEYACVSNATGAALELGVVGGANVVLTSLYASGKKPAGK